MSIFVSDANAPDLLTGATLGSAGTTNGTAVQVDWPGLVEVEINGGTITGTNSVLIQGSDDVAWGAGTIVTLASIPLVAADSSVRRVNRTDIRTKYVRARLTVGTSTTGTTIKLLPLRYKWTKLDSQAAVT